MKSANYAVVCAKVCDDLYKTGMAHKIDLAKLDTTIRYNFHKYPYNIQFVTPYVNSNGREHDEVLTFVVTILKDKIGTIHFTVQATIVKGTPSIFNIGTPIYQKSYRGWKKDLPYGDVPVPDTWQDLVKVSGDRLESLNKKLTENRLAMGGTCGIWMSFKMDKVAVIEYNWRRGLFGELDIDTGGISFWKKRKDNRLFKHLGKFSQILAPSLQPFLNAQLA